MDTDDESVPDQPMAEQPDEQSPSEQSVPQHPAPDPVPEQSASERSTPLQPESSTASYNRTILLNHIAELKSRIASLTGNPGVIATFFLSAVDGAIIYKDWDRAPIADLNAAGVNGTESGSINTFPEAMASEIFAYVTAATRFSQAFTRPILALHDETYTAESPREEDRVGLLRMRTQSSEVIIFPTSSYIMCVLNKITLKERTTKASNGTGPRPTSRDSPHDAADLVRDLSVQDDT